MKTGLDVQCNSRLFVYNAMREVVICSLLVIDDEPRVSSPVGVACAQLEPFRRMTLFSPLF